MNYQKIYNDLILKAKSENRKKLKRDHPNYVYYERHHIIPKCLNGLDSKENLVLLTAREHFVAHKLLHYIYPKNKLLFYSFYMMCYCKNENQQRFNKISSHEYEYLKIINSKLAYKKFGKENNPLYGKFGKENPNFGIKRSKQTLKKMSESQKGKKHTKETIEKIRKNKLEFFKINDSPNKNKPMSELQKIKISNKIKKVWLNNDLRNQYIKSAKNRPKIECPWCKKLVDISTAHHHHFEGCVMNPNNDKKLHEPKYKHKTLICPHCGKIGAGGNMKRYHFKNCKLNQNNTPVYLIRGI